MLHDAEMAKNKINLSTSLEQIALDKGFRVVNNRGQGNCMFHALSDQLKLVMRISVSHEQLRHAAIDYLGSDEAAALVSCSFCYYLHVFPTLIPFSHFPEYTLFTLLNFA